MATRFRTYRRSSYYYLYAVIVVMSIFLFQYGVAYIINARQESAWRDKERVVKGAGSTTNLLALLFPVVSLHLLPHSLTLAV